MYPDWLDETRPALTRAYDIGLEGHPSPMSSGLRNTLECRNAYQAGRIEFLEREIRTLIQALEERRNG